jgi:hypothetical protein
LARMSKSRRNTSFLPLDDALFAGKPRKPVPHEFVLDAIATLSPKTRSMFGCLAIYVQDKIVLILRDKRDQAADNGVWLATPKTITGVCGGSSPTCDPSKCWGRR